MKNAAHLRCVGFVWINGNFQNLDALHDHLGTIYPGMRAPSFRCTDAEKGNSLILHYYSEREGLQDIVIGIIKTVAQQIHGTEIEMKVSIFFPLFLLCFRWGARDYSHVLHNINEDIRENKGEQWNSRKARQMQRGFMTAAGQHQCWIMIWVIGARVCKCFKTFLLIKM